MPHGKLEAVLAAEIKALENAGRRKGAETVFTGVVPAGGGRGPRYLVEGSGGKTYLRMNSNGYLGLAMDVAVRDAEEAATREFGVGPGAVRFISGTWAPHVALERRLARFHGRESAMIFSSAYAAVMGVLPPMIGEQTAVISDALNHNSIINALRLARPKAKHVYHHLDLNELQTALSTASRDCRRAIVVTDGVFSMRGDHAPVADIMAIARDASASFAEDVVVVVDDSHGVGAFGDGGRGTEAVAGAEADLLVATLGKAFGVNGGYVAGPAGIIDFLRETSPFYVYSNPITPGEAAAATAAVDIVDGARGERLLRDLAAMSAHLRDGIAALDLETIAGTHPIVPLMVRDTRRTHAIVQHLKNHGILATGLGYPVVPKGDEEIRFQVSADHTAADIDEVLSVLDNAPR